MGVKKITTMDNDDSSTEDILQSSYLYGSSPLTPTSLSSPRTTFLIGNPISHSLAPLLHNTLFSSLSIPWTYTLLETPTTTPFLPTLKSPHVIGCAITMPYKTTLLSALDAITPAARLLGAINTVFVRQSRTTGSPLYIGTNTDTIGVRDAFLRNYPGMAARTRGKAGLVVGGGGACRSAVYALWKDLGVRCIYLVNRLASEVDAIIASFTSAPEFDCELIFVDSVDRARGLEMPVVVVGTVPDFVPLEEGERRAAEVVRYFLHQEGKGFGEGQRKGWVLEMCYHPKIRTAFYELAESEGWNVLPGTEAMIYQGVAQQVLWTEVPFGKFPVDDAKRVIEKALVNH